MGCSCSTSSKPVDSGGAGGDGGDGGAGKAGGAGGAITDLIKEAKAGVALVKRQGKKQIQQGAELVAEASATFEKDHPELTHVIVGATDAIEKNCFACFLLGFVGGLAGSKLDPGQLVKAIAVDFEADWVGMKEAVEALCGHVQKTGGSLFEDVEDGFERAGKFLEALLPLCVNIKKTIHDISTLVDELTGPVKMVEHIIKMATPPYIALVEQVVKDLYHLTLKKYRERDVAAIHMFVAAWDSHPRTHKEWHKIGESVGVMCLATVGV